MREVRDIDCQLALLPKLSYVLVLHVAALRYLYQDLLCHYWESPPIGLQEDMSSWERPIGNVNQGEGGYDVRLLVSCDRLNFFK